MILKGSQRGGGRQLAQHLLRTDENDHVEIEQMRGFTARDLEGALDEAHAISKGTRCKQFMFSLSINPPKDEKVGIDELMDAVDRAEERLGLTGQPRVVVTHEKNGRRHAHAVWSRINANEMKAVHLPYFKNRLAALSKELYLEHEWNLPEGHQENGWKNPLNFTLAEWQQAKRIGLDPREIKQLFRDAWKHSDGFQSFRAALEDRGYYLAKGDRRGFVAVDLNGEIFSVSRMLGIKTKELEARLGSPDQLTPVSEVHAGARDHLTGRVGERLTESRRAQRREMAPLKWDHRKMVRTQRTERAEMAKSQKEHRAQRNRERSARLHDGFYGVVQILTGQSYFIRKQNVWESYEEYQQYRRERENLIEQHTEERRQSLRKIEAMRARQRAERMLLAERMAFLLVLEESEQARKSGRDAAPRPPRNNLGPSLDL